MSPRRELLVFSLALGVLVGGFFGEALFAGKVLSPADVLFASASFREFGGEDYEPRNRLLMDPVLQFQPWLELNRRLLREGRLPLWNASAGCGAPHLANGQAAVFDPFHLIAYLGRLPEAHAPMAAARLWFAGLGMFLLARAWGYGPWGRWFAGLTFPFCGFLVGWLLYPVTNVAVWMPWVFLATEQVWTRPGWRPSGWLAVAVGGSIVGGHVQTSAHLLLASGVYAAWRWWKGGTGRGALAWGFGVALGFGVAAVEVVPLGAYLADSPVWGDRDRERVSPWKLARPRVLDAACTALPYLYGSQRRGQPNLARALGVHNLNESAGGFAGLATLIWLAPLAWSARREVPRVRFLAGLTLFGFLAAFQLPPVDNLLRALPVLGVTDNRRLTLWVAFGLAMLGGVGLDHLERVRGSRGWRIWGWAWLGAGLLSLVAASSLGRLEPMIQARAEAHYARAAERTPGADPRVYRARAERQVRESVRFVPLYLTFAGGQMVALAWLLGRVRGGVGDPWRARGGLLTIALVDLFVYGFGLNPAIPPVEDRPVPAIVAELQSSVGRRGRVLGLGEELPPNVLMRYGLLDPRNYDSVELSRSLSWFEPLYDPAVQARTSRREVTWDRVAAARDRLAEASVAAIVSATPPPPGLGETRRVGSVWLTRLPAEPLVSLEPPGNVERWEIGDGWVAAEVAAEGPGRLIARETLDAGWRVKVDGRPGRVEAYRDTFLSVAVSGGRHQILFTYDPFFVKFGWWMSAIAVLATVFTLTGFGLFRFTRIVVHRLGRIQAVGLESDASPIPDDPPGEEH